jgi:hypothetical protein
MGLGAAAVRGDDDSGADGVDGRSQPVIITTATAAIISPRGRTIINPSALLTRGIVMNCARVRKISGKAQTQPEDGVLVVHA